MVDYGRLEEMNSAHTNWTNLVSNISSLSQEERIWKVKRGEYGFRFLMCTEQNNTARMNKFLQKLKRSEGLVMCACDAIFSVAKVCMPLPKHSRFIERELSPNCVNEAWSQLILISTQQLLSRRTDTDGD